MKNALKLLLFSFVVIAFSVSKASAGDLQNQDSEAMRVKKCRASSKKIAELYIRDSFKYTITHPDIGDIEYWYDHCSPADLPGELPPREKALDRFEWRAAELAAERECYQNPNRSESFADIQDRIERGLSAKREAQAERVEREVQSRAVYDKVFASVQIGS